MFCRFLQEESDNETELRRIFRKARTKVRVELRSQLTNFRESLSRGLGKMFGAEESDLLQALNDRNKELQIIDQVLFPVLENAV